MKTIILATDFSPVSLNAAAYAVKMANVVNANILLFNVYEVIPNYGEIIFDVNVDDLKETAEDQITKFRLDILQQTNSNCVITTEVRLGVFKDEMLSVCERISPYAVVMGSQGKSESELLFMGTHAGKTINHFAWPLITVPASATYSTIKKIGVAYDFAEAIDDQLIGKIKLLAQDFNASIDILNSAHEDEFDENFIFLSRMLENSFKPLLVTYHFLTSQHNEESILKFVDSNKIDLLIVMPKYHSFLQKIFHRSYTKQLVLHCHVPVMSLSK